MDAHSIGQWSLQSSYTTETPTGVVITVVRRLGSFISTESVIRNPKYDWGKNPEAIFEPDWCIVLKAETVKHLPAQKHPLRRTI